MSGPRIENFVQKVLNDYASLTKASVQVGSHAYNPSYVNPKSDLDILIITEQQYEGIDGVSHKYEFQEQDYRTKVSVHIINEVSFERTSRLEQQTLRLLRSSRKNGNYELYNMNGVSISHSPMSEETTNGHVTEVPVYDIVDGEFYLGIHPDKLLSGAHVLDNVDYFDTVIDNLYAAIYEKFLEQDKESHFGTAIINMLSRRDRFSEQTKNGINERVNRTIGRFS